VFECEEVYRDVLRVLQENDVPFLVGGAYAFCVYTGIRRDTKDFDLFLRPADFECAAALFEKSHFTVLRSFPHWLGKIKCSDHYVDLIYRMGNGLTEVDASWFERAQADEVLGWPIQLCAPEDMLWSKAFIMERERFDGADVAHLIQSCAKEIDWDHLVARFGEDWRILFAHLVLFGYIYPAEKGRVPRRVMDALVARLQNDADEASQICRGTLLSREQYLVDVQERGYVDARLEDRSCMSADDIEQWTRAIGREE
jgi:hypothetical protein